MPVSISTFAYEVAPAVTVTATGFDTPVIPTWAVAVSSYVPGSKERVNRPWASHVVDATVSPDGSRATTRALGTGVSGQGLPTRSTGQCGPRSTEPVTADVPVSWAEDRHAPIRSATRARAIFPFTGGWTTPAEFLFRDDGSGDGVAVHLGLEGAHEGEVAEPLAVVEPVADHEHRRDLEQPVLDIQRHLLHVALLHERADLQAGRASFFKVLQQIRHRHSRLDDVFYD